MVRKRCDPEMDKALGKSKSPSIAVRPISAPLFLVLR
jgi:hypothetical protein